MGSRQGDNLAIIESHAIKDLAEMVMGQGGIGKPTSRWALGVIHEVRSTRLPVYLGPAHLLHRNHTYGFNDG
jgi:hypothetical protein